jgi:hypothetical protein
MREMGGVPLLNREAAVAIAKRIEIRKHAKHDPKESANVLRSSVA